MTRSSQGPARARALALASALMTALAALPGAPLAALPPLIPRAVLFGNPEREQPLVSPDGRRLAFLRRARSGVMAVWVRTLGRSDDAMATRDTVRGVGNYQWAPDGRHILYFQDSGGDENYHLFSADLETRVVRDLTPFQGIRAENLLTDVRHAGEVLVGLNLRDARVSDMYRIDLSTGAVRLDTRNPGDVVAWTVDADFRIRAATALDPKTGDTILRVRDRAEGAWRDLVRWSFEDAGIDRYQRILGFTGDGAALYAQSPVGSNTTRLVTLAARDGHEIETIASDPRCDLWNDYVPTSPQTEVAILAHPTKDRIQAVGLDYLRPEWKVLDPALAADFALLGRTRRGTIDVMSRSASDSLWTVAFRPDDGPTTYYLYDRVRKRPQLLFVGRPELSKLALAPMKPIVVRARDGLDLPCYLTLPVGVPARRLPLVLLVHGGPWFRDHWGYDDGVQWLANRGYAVLQVEFRGSTGFGTRFLNAGDHQLGVGGMQNDLSDAVRWAVRAGIADSARVGIMGWSYGGYATLAGLAFTPELYACGVDGVGPANMRTLIESFPPYWAARKRRWLNRVGDVIQDDALNRRISPLFHAGSIRAPLVIGHGANDPRCKLAESEAMVAALRANHVPVTFVVYPDEGHGFGRPENNLDFFGRVEEFLAKHLGGRVEPWHKIEGSSAEVR